MEITILLAALLASAPAPADTPPVKTGSDAGHELNDSAAAPLADQWKVDAPSILGEVYHLGHECPPDPSLVQGLELGARNGHLDAQATLGLLLFECGNRVGSLHWLKLAADGGEPRALLQYGTALFNGEGVARNAPLAYATISRAAGQGYAPAEMLLAQMDQFVLLQQRKEGASILLAKTVKPLQIALAVPGKPKAQIARLGAAASAGRGRWRVQLGAFSNRGSAQILYKRLGSTRALAGRQAYFVPAGAMTRLQVGPFGSRAAAAAACALLDGQVCFPKAAK
ncbi:MAG: SPOR domain-containing protein [Sphingomicrobium sp.]